MKKVYRIFIIQKATGALWDAGNLDILPHDIDFESEQDAEFHLQSWSSGENFYKNLTYIILPVFKMEA